MYRYTYQRYFIILSVFSLIIAIIVIIFFQKLRDEDKKDINKICLFKKNTFCQFSDIVKINNYANYDTIFLNIIKRQSYLYKNQEKITIYNHFVLSSNTSLSTILQKCTNRAINICDIQRLTEKYPALKNLTPGQALSCLVLNEKKIQCLIWQSSSKKIYIYNNINNYFTEGIIKILRKSIDESCYTLLFVGKLNGTFIDSVRALGITKNCILDVITALKCQLDFRKLHQGDRFTILVSLVFDDHQKEQSHVIGARLYTAGKNYYMFQLSNGKFYNRDAIRVGNNCICFPVLGPYRISSNFNLHRMNPITRQISPHAGVDFAVPIGTPVLSVGDGEVIISKYSKIAGNYIGIKHNYQCITRYMHLKKVLVKPGQKVKKGDQIALSGNTGRSTGPHLHFEIWLNHRPVNPLTTNIVNLEKLLGKERKQFLLQIEKIIPELNFD